MAISPCWDPDNIPWISAAVSVPYLKVNEFLEKQPAFAHSMDLIEWTVLHAPDESAFADLGPQALDC